MTLCKQISYLVGSAAEIGLTIVVAKIRTKDFVIMGHQCREHIVIVKKCPTKQELRAHIGQRWNSWKGL